MKRIDRYSLLILLASKYKILIYFYFFLQGRKGRKFIDKKADNVYSFRIGARSQRDPLAADENAPQGVLIDDNQHVGFLNDFLGKMSGFLLVFAPIYFARQINYIKIFSA